jgi:hypothetical protein
LASKAISYRVDPLQEVHGFRWLVAAYFAADHIGDFVVDFIDDIAADFAGNIAGNIAAYFSGAPAPSERSISPRAAMARVANASAR